MPEKFLRLPEVRNRVPFSRATIYRLMALGEFPQPYSIGARAVAWRESDIAAWIEERLNETAPKAVGAVGIRQTSIDHLIAQGTIPALGN